MTTVFHFLWSLRVMTRGNKKDFLEGMPQTAWPLNTIMEKLVTNHVKVRHFLRDFRMHTTLISYNIFRRPAPCVEQSSQLIGKKTCEANPADENSSFILTCCFRSVSFYQVKLVYVVPYMIFKEFFETCF